MEQLELKEKHKEWMVHGVVIAACLLAAYFILIRPAVERGNALRESIRTSNKRLELFKEIATINTKLQGMESSFTFLEDQPLLLGKISDMASNARISVQSVTPKTEALGPYTNFTLELDLKSSFFNLLGYLGAIEKLHPAFIVKDISITKSVEGRGPGAPTFLQSKMILQTLLKQKAGKP